MANKRQTLPRRENRPALQRRQVSRRRSRSKRSNFEDDRKDQRALRSLLVDVTLEINADFFFDDRPVGTLFGIGRVDRTQDDIARTGDQVTAVVAHESARDDFRLRLEFAGVLVDGNDGDDDAVFGKMFAVANDDFFDFLKRAGINENPASGNGIAAKCPVFCEFDVLPVFNEKDFATDDPQLMRKRGVAEKMAKLTVDGNEIFRFYQLKDEFLFFLAGVAGNVNDPGGIVVVDQSAASEHVVQHPEDGFFVPRNDARRKNDRVVFVDGNESVIIDSDAGERRHGFGLRAGSENDDFARIK